MSNRIAGLPGFKQVDHIGLTVPDINAAINFYGKVFGAKVISRLGPIGSSKMPRSELGTDWMGAHIDVPNAKLEKAVLQLGSSMRIELFQYYEPLEVNRTPPKNCDIGGHHIAYTVTKLEPAIEYLTSIGCKAMEGLIDVAPNERSQYLTDPWGNYFELMEYYE